MNPKTLKLNKLNQELIDQIRTKHRLLISENQIIGLALYCLVNCPRMDFNTISKLFNKYRTMNNHSKVKNST